MPEPLASCRPRWENEALEEGGKFSREFWVVLCVLLAAQMRSILPSLGFQRRLPLSGSQCDAGVSMPALSLCVVDPSLCLSFPTRRRPPNHSAPSLKQAPSHVSPAALFRGISLGYCHYGYYYYYYYYWDVGGALRLCRTRLWRARHPSKGRSSVTAPQQLRSPQLEEVMKQFMGIYKVMCE